MSLADRATISNMAPEYGATIGFFPVDAESLNYLRATGRTKDEVELVERYCKEQGLFRTDATPAPTFTKTVSLDLSTVEPSLAGPKRPQDRVALGRDEGDLAQVAASAGHRARLRPGRGAQLTKKAAVKDNGHSADIRPRRGRHRGDHELHEHQQPVGDARRRSAGEKGGRAGPGGAAAM